MQKHSLHALALALTASTRTHADMHMMRKYVTIGSARAAGWIVARHDVRAHALICISIR